MKTPAQTAGVRNTVILCVIYYGIRPAGVIIGKTGDTRFILNWVSLFYGHSAFTVPNRKKLPKKVSKRVLREGGKSAIITEYTVQAGSARPEA